MPRMITGIVFALLFAVAAYVQMNDADGESRFWIVVYAVVSLLSLLFAFKALPRMLAWLVAGAALAGAAGLAFRHSQSGEPWNPDDQFLAESVREAGGLAVAGIWLFIAGAVRRRRPPKK